MRVSQSKIAQRFVRPPVLRPADKPPHPRPYCSPAPGSVNDTVGERLDIAIKRAKTPSASPPELVPLLTQAPPSPIKLPDPIDLDICKVHMRPHPVYELLEAIIKTTPRPKPRGRSLNPPQTVQQMLTVLPSEKYFEKDDLLFSLQAQPPLCIKLAAHKYLCISSQSRLNALKGHGIRMVPFRILPAQKGLSPAETLETAITESARLAFLDLRRDEPLFLRPEIRIRLYRILCQAGLDAYFFKSMATEHVVTHQLQLAPSTWRAYKQKRARKLPGCTK